MKVETKNQLYLGNRGIKKDEEIIFNIIVLFKKKSRLIHTLLVTNH